MIYVVDGGIDMMRALRNAIERAVASNNPNACITMRIELPDGRIAILDPHQVSEGGEGHIGVLFRQIYEGDRPVTAEEAAVEEFKPSTEELVIEALHHLNVTVTFLEETISRLKARVGVHLATSPTVDRSAMTLDPR